ncbi:MAG TPA: carboxypeptidase-like regulatory domain-containing protein [Micromonosporaceae bacterium]|nr:carboxypeptidase-like regulatory domain-containing protein [Micromonosporaceae bacterium]
MAPHRRVLLAAVAAVLVLAGLAACSETPVSSDDPAPGGGAATHGTVAGTVRTATGTAVSGATVLPKSVDDPANPVPEMLVATDASGRYEWSLPPGRYELTVQPPGGAAGSPVTQPVTVTAGATTTLDFTLG